MATTKAPPKPKPLEKKKRTATPDLPLVTRRMLELMEYSIANSHVKTQKEWCKLIGLNPANMVAVRSGNREFTDKQKLAAIKLIKGNMNWLFDLEPNMIRTAVSKSGLDLIKEGVSMLEKKK